LQETTDATLLLHVIDTYDEERQGHIDEVEKVLSEIGADEVPLLQVYNKIDKMPGHEPRIDRDSDGVPIRVWLSAASGQGVDLLLTAINERLSDDVFNDVMILKPRDGQLRAQLYAQGAIVDEQVDEVGDIHLKVRLQRKDLLKILTRLGLPTEQYRIKEVY
jgi:GTP-binding protein HflX